MGRYFQTKEDLYRLLCAFYEKASSDPILITKMNNADMIWRINCFDPKASVSVHFGDPKFCDEKALCYKTNGGEKMENHKDAHAVFSMSADFHHSFWLGREHMGNAIINGRVRASGNYLRALAMIPDIRPIFRTYKNTLEELGLAKLIPSK